MQNKTKSNIEQINNTPFCYKLGVMCGQMLYETMKFDNFEKMIQEAHQIDEKYQSDMQKCDFVIQTYKDNSYNFESSCISQIRLPVNDIKTKSEDIAGKILSDYAPKNKGRRGEWWHNEEGGYLCSLCGCFYDDVCEPIPLPLVCPRCKATNMENEDYEIDRNMRLSKRFVYVKEKEMM